MSYVQGLECRECKQQYANQPTHAACCASMQMRSDVERFSVLNEIIDADIQH